MPFLSGSLSLCVQWMRRLANKDGDGRKTLRGNNSLAHGSGLRDQEKRIYSAVEMKGFAPARGAPGICESEMDQA